MATIAESLNHLSATWAGLILAAIWQSTFLAILIALVASRLKTASPGVRYWLWQIVAFKLLIVPFWTVLIPWPALFPQIVSDQLSPLPPALAASTSSNRPDRRAALPDPTAAEPSSLDGPLVSTGSSGLSTTSWLMAAWLMVVAFQVLLVFRQRSTMVRLLRQTTPVEDMVLKTQVAELADRLALGRVPDVRSTWIQGSPFVCGLFRPMLVLPEGLTGSLEPDELRQVLVHELAHVKRGDLFWDWFPAIARMLFFFHPVAHWAAGRILLERELACDQAAISLSSKDAASYARMLVQVAGAASFPWHASANAIDSRFENLSSRARKPESAR